MVSEEKDKSTDYKALGFMFMTLGVSMSVTFWLSFGPLFALSGLAFVLAGFVFLFAKQEEEK